MAAGLETGLEGAGEFDRIGVAGLDATGTAELACGIEDVTGLTTLENEGTAAGEVADGDTIPALLPYGRPV